MRLATKCGAAALVGDARRTLQKLIPIGDGAMSMLMGELVTAVKYQLPIKVFVLENGTRCAPTVYRKTTV